MQKHYKNFSQIITLTNAHNKDGRNLAPEDLSIIENASIIFDDKEILWVGPSSNLPSEFSDLKPEDFTGKILLPGIVDSHTHLVFAGDRSKEYAMRLNGASYEEIAAAGGGILNTVSATKDASFDELYELGKKRIEKIHQHGVQTIEIKSGYGLTFESEELISRVIHKLKQDFCGKVQIINTFLAAHAIPVGDTSQNYIKNTCIPLMQKLASESIIDFVDIFHEQNYFTEQDTKSLFDAAQELKLKIKIHADELNDNDGASIAVDYSAFSADHLLCISDKNIKKMANSNTVASLLPGTALFLGKPLAPARKMLDAGCKVAIASDYNPGSCHFDNLPLLTAISSKLLNMNIAELTAAITLNAAAALGLEKQGAIITGHRPIFTILDFNSIDQFYYNW